MDTQKIEEAIIFALESENKVDVNLENAIIKAFGSDPYFEIKGPTKTRGKSNGVIIKNGYIIGKWGDVNRVDMTFSVTKSYLSTVAGIAFDRGLIELQDPLKKYVWDGKFDSDPETVTVLWDYDNITRGAARLFGFIPKSLSKSS